MRIYIEKELVNVAPRFTKAIWRERDVRTYYDSAAEANLYHKLQNCKYQYEDEDGNVLSRYNNANVDGYGRRYR